MAVEIIHFMPDVEVHRGETDAFARSLEPRKKASLLARLNGRALFVCIVAALHVAAFIPFVNAQRHERALDQPTVIEASFFEDAPAESEPPPPVYVPPEQVMYELPAPEVAISIEAETITPPPVQANAITDTPRVVTPPLVESVEYVRTPLPIYPRESSRRREHGTVLLRVFVDAGGRAAQVQVEQSSGYERLDTAALDAVRRWLFRPHEVNGIAQAVQVLVPVEFASRAS